MVGAVYSAVTVEAVLTQYILIGGAVGGAATVVLHAGMEGGRVALLAQKGPTCGQQAGVHRTVWFVTGAAIFSYRWVIPQVWTALVVVTAVAVVIQGRLYQVRLAGAAVWIVAVDAGGLAFEYRMARR